MMELTKEKAKALSILIEIGMELDVVVPSRNGSLKNNVVNATVIAKYPEIFLVQYQIYDGTKFHNIKTSFAYKEIMLAADNNKKNSTPTISFKKKH